VKITKNNFEGYLVVFKNFLAESSDEPLSGLDVEISGDKVTATLVENSIVMFRASPMQPAFTVTFRFIEATSLTRGCLGGISSGE